MSNRRQADYANGGQKRQLQRMWEKYEGICQIRNHKIRRDQASREHVVPLWRGGVRGDENCVLACRECNLEANRREQTTFSKDYRQCSLDDAPVVI